MNFTATLITNQPDGRTAQVDIFAENESYAAAIALAEYSGRGEPITTGSVIDITIDDPSSPQTKTPHPVVDILRWRRSGPAQRFREIEPDALRRLDELATRLGC